MTYCKHCGTPLADNHCGPCFECGQRGKVIEAGVTLGTQADMRSDAETWREVVTEHPRWTLASVAISLGAPLLGLVVGGGVAVALGVTTSAVTIILSTLAIRREIRRVN